MKSRVFKIRGAPNGEKSFAYLDCIPIFTDIRSTIEVQETMPGQVTIAREEFIQKMADAQKRALIKYSPIADNNDVLNELIIELFGPEGK